MIEQGEAAAKKREPTPADKKDLSVAELTGQDTTDWQKWLALMLNHNWII
jgi:hypothetical protein